jgi:hypothetical protein
MPILARSYDVDECIMLDTPTGDDFSIRVAIGDKYTELSVFDLLEEIEGCDEDETKRRILGWRSDAGVLIGHHILTTAQKVACSPRFEVYREYLPKVIRETLYIHNFFDVLIRRFDIAATVLTHICYNIWGILGEMSLRNGAQLFHVRTESDISAAVIREPPIEPQLLGSMVRHAEASIFNNYVWPNRAKLRALSDKIVEYVTEGDHLAPPWWVKHKAEKGNHSVDRRTVMRRLGWAEDKPVYSILNHAMTDDVYTDTQAFIDCHDWLRQTLAFAAKDDSRYWLFKRHPHDHRYDTSNTFNLLAEKYHKLPHIRFIADGLTKRELFAVSSLALTIRGSLGFEFAAKGIPVIMSGRSRMSDIGFASIADDVETYFDLLRKPLKDLAISAEQVERARLYTLCSRLIVQLSSDFVPTMTFYNDSNADAIWDYLARLLTGVNVETDNYYRNMVRCLDQGLPWIINLEFLQLLNESKNVEPHVVESAKAHA